MAPKRKRGSSRGRGAASSRRSGGSSSATTSGSSGNTGTTASRRRQQQSSSSSATTTTPSTPLSGSKNSNKIDLTAATTKLNPQSVLGSLLCHLLHLSNDKSKCTAALQCLLDGKFVTGLEVGDTGASGSASALAQAPPESPDSFGSSQHQQQQLSSNPCAEIILIATHAINRLIASLRKAGEDESADGDHKKRRKDSSDDNDSEREKKKRSIVITLVALARALSGVLLADRPKLERCANATHAPLARSAVGRAVVSIAIGSILALECLTEITSDEEGKLSADSSSEKKDGAAEEQNMEKDEKDLIRRAAWSALTCLEMVVHLSLKPSVSVSSSSSNSSGGGASSVIAAVTGVPPPSSGSYTSSSTKCHKVPNKSTIATWDSFMSTIVGDAGQMNFHLSSSDASDLDNQYTPLAAACQDVSGVVFPDSSDEKGVSAVLSAISSVEGASVAVDDLVDTPPAAVPPPSKRARRASRRKQQQNAVEESSSTKTAAAASASCPAAKMLLKYPENSITFDGRVSIRRWASMAFVWLCHGQKKALRLAITMLENFRFWEKILEPMTPAVAAAANVSESRKKRSQSPFTLSTTPARKRGKGRRGATHLQHEITEKNDNDVSSKLPLVEPSAMVSSIPGNVAIVAYVARLIDLISETGTPCGVRPPTGGMELYAALVLGQEENDTLSEPSQETPQHSSTALNIGRMSPSAVASSSASVPRDHASVAFPRQLGRMTRSHAAAAAGGVGRSTRSRSNAAASFAQLGDFSTPLAALMEVSSISSQYHHQQHPLTRPDVREEAAVVTGLLITAHYRCLRENFKARLEINVTSAIDDTESKMDFDSKAAANYVQGSPTMLLLNDDNPATVLGWGDLGSTIPRSASSINGPESIDMTVVGFYPFLHLALDKLAGAAASSVVHSAHIDASDSILRLQVIGSALVLGQEVDVNDNNGGDSGASMPLVLDAKLCSMAIDQLSECIGGIIAGNVTSSLLSSSTRNEEDAVENSENADEDSGPLSDTNLPKISKSLVRKYNLNNALAPYVASCPSISSREAAGNGITGGSTGSKSSMFCTFGGVFASSDCGTGSGDDDKQVGATVGSNREEQQQGDEQPQRSITPEEILALFLRAQIPKSQEDKNESNVSVTSLAPSNLLTELFRVVHCCYDVNISQADARKDGAPTGSDQKSKRDKVVKGVESKLNSPMRMTFTRCALASDALTVLRKILALLHPNRTRTFALSSLGLSQEGPASSSILLQSYLRRSITTKHICEFVELGYMMEEVLVHPRIVASKKKDDARPKISPASLLTSASVTNANEFEPWERRLWSAHAKLCLTIGRGQPSFDSQNRIPSEQLILGDSSRRLATFQAVVRGARREKFFSATSQNNDIDSVSNRWPLCLSVIQHALVSSNLSANITNGDASPERFLCESFLASVSDALKNLDLAEEHAFQNRDIKSSQQCVSDENVPLSLRDARLFVVSVGRLPREEQKVVLSRLLEATSTIMNSVPSKEKVRQIVSRSSSASGFLARVLTVCSTLVDLVSVGKDLLDSLVSQVGPAHYHLPSLLELSSSDDTNENAQSDCDWYKREKCFMGIFSDWETSAAPLVTTNDITQALSKEDMTKFDKVLEISLELGFSAAKKDRCHLLFSAWNASGKSSGWNDERWSDPSSASMLKTVSYPRALITLRDDMCGIYRSFGFDEDYVPDTLLTKLLQDKDEKKRRSSPVKSTSVMLRQGMKEALSLLGSHIAELTEQNTSSSKPLPAFALLEAIPVHISFLLSLHTKPAVDDSSFLSYSRGQKSRGRRRKNSGVSSDSLDEDNIISDESGEESDGGYQDYDDDEDVLDSLARLHDSCNALGAAPFHPDWLDMNCRLREGVENSLVIESAEMAITSLTTLGSVAYEQYIKSLQQALTLGHVLDATEEQRVADSTLALHIITAMSSAAEKYQTPGKSEPNSALKSVKNTVASLCNIDMDVIGCMVSGLSCKNQNSAKEAWCPNSAHRIRGRLQASAAIEGWEATSGEKRAAGEWELLLSDTLLGACMDFSTSENEKTDGNSRSSPKDAAEPYFVLAERWRRVLQASINCFVPATALLRFGLNGCKGCRPHPLSRRDSTTGNNSQLVLNPNIPLPSHQLESILASTSLSTHSIETCVFKSLSFLTSVSSGCQSKSSMRQTCRAAASHFVGNSTHVTNLEGLMALRLHFAAVSSICRLLESNCKADAKSLAATIVEKLLESIENLADSEECGGMSLFTGKGSFLENTRTTPPRRNKSKLMRLISFFGFPSVLQLETIGNASKVDHMTLLSYRKIPFLAEEEDANKKTIKVLVSMLEQNFISLKMHIRCKIACMLSGALDVERKLIKTHFNANRQAPSVLPAVLEAWNALGPNRLESIIKEDICLLPSSGASRVSDVVDEQAVALSKQLVLVISFLVRSISGTPGLEVAESTGCKHVLHTMLQTLAEWAECHTPYSLDLLYLLASRFDALKDTGTELLKILGEMRTCDQIENQYVLCHFLEAIRRFFSFTLDVDNALKGGVKLTSAYSQISTTEPNFTREESHENIPFKSVSLSGQGSKKLASGSSYFVTKSGRRVLRTCSFVETGGDFKEQHWYNCYTCGLLWDKGCCSLCAQVCHKGHDVGYSRRSSFFCDCGAEVSSAGDQNRVSCRCLNPLSANELSTLYETNESVTISPVVSDEKMLPNLSRGKSEGNSGADDRLNILDIISEGFLPEAQLSLNNFLQEAKHSSWVEALFELFHSCFEKWLKTKDKLAMRDMLVEKEDESCQRLPGNPAIRARDGKPLEVTSINDKSMAPIRYAKANSVNIKVSVDSTTDRIKKSIMSKNEISRHAIVADYRGRIIIAEPCSLLFCSLLPLANVRHNPNHELPLDRAQLCVLGTASVKFNIVGMQICPVNDRHLLVWGTTEVCIIVLSDSCDSIERTIELIVELEPHECDTEYLLKGMWLPGSESIAVVVFGTFIKCFDVKRSSGGTPDKDCTCRSTNCLTLAYEDVLIRDATLTFGCQRGPVAENPNPSLTDKEGASTIKLALLLDTGRLYMTDLAIDSNGDLEDQGESYIECGDGISFPTAGIRRYSGANPGVPGSTSTSFGEGSSLLFLTQSRILVYKCVSSSVVAFILDGEGNIAGSFEFLPHVLTSEMLGTGNDGYSISAPYTHWTELGTVQRDEGCFYRIACVGKSTRTNQPKLLCVEFNKEFVRVKELSSSGRNMGLGLSSLSSSIEGIAAFSAPYLMGPGTEKGMFGSHGYSYERSFLVTLTSSGSLLIFGEECEDKESEQEKGLHSRNLTQSRAPQLRDLSDSAMGGGCDVDSRRVFGLLDEKDSEDIKAKQPTFPLTVFETLVNASEMEELTFGGDGVGSEPSAVKRKLSINSGEFIISQSREGCTLTVRLRSKKQSKEITPKKDHGKQPRSRMGSGSSKPMGSSVSEKSAQKDLPPSAASHAIVAIRVLVGSTTTEYIPKFVTVMGRPTKLTQGLKRWYGLPLTDEEILLGVRNGFVSIGIGPSFDSSNSSLIDSVECYLLKRTDLAFLSTDGIIQKTTSQEVETNDKELKSNEERQRKNLILSMQAVTHACRVLRVKVDSSHANRKVMHQLVQASALDSHFPALRDNVSELLKEVERDENARQELLDEGTLLGSVKALNDIKRIFESRERQSDLLYSDPSDSDLADKSSNNQDRVAANAEMKSHCQSFSEGSLAHVINTFNQCLQSSLSIAKDRPANYCRSIDKMVSDGSASASIANEAKSVLELFINTPVDYGESVSSWTDLTLLELAMGSKKNQYYVENVQFATFDTIADAIKSCNLSIAEHCCSSLADFFQKSENTTDSQPEKPSDSNAEKSDSVAFQCDGCSIFPIQFKRYTLEGHDIDLCKKCFESCCEYARAHQNNPSQVVVISGKTLSLGGDEEMTCSQIWRMCPMSIASSIVEQVEQVRRAAEADPSNSTFDDRAFGDDDDAALQLALKMSLESQHDVSPPEDETATPLYESEDFISNIFSGLLDLAVGSLSSETDGVTLHHPTPLFQLILKLIQNSETEEQRLQKGQKMAEAFCDRVALLVQSCIEQDPSKEATAQARSSLIIAIRALVSLIVQKFSLDGFDPSSVPEQEDSNDNEGFSLSPSSVKKKDKTDPRFVCEVHGVPAVRRRCSHGAHKDRRFYVCGLERKQRCRYFKWADPDGDEKPSKSPMALHGRSGSFSPEPSPTAALSSENGKEQDAINQYLWKLLSKPIRSGEKQNESSRADATTHAPNCPDKNSGTKLPSLQSKLCELLEICFRSSESSSISDGPSLRRDSDASAEKSSMPSLRSEKNKKDELNDGVRRSREKLGPRFSGVGNQSGERAVAISVSKSFTSIPNEELVVVQACLDLLSMVATNSLKKTPPSSSTEVSNWSSDWFSLLCEIISTNSSNKANLRNTAKKMLRRLCGGRRAVYHRVRDHYIFRIQFWNLLHHCEEPLTSALLVREKARLSGPNWQSGEYNWSNLPAGGLIGVGDLISEDNLTVENDEKIRQVLDELIDVTKSRGGNWRQFCGLTELPRPSSGKKGFELASKVGKITDGNIHSRPPICSMLWIACSISGSNQIKSLRMIDVALSSEDGKEMIPMDRKAWPHAADEMLSTDVGTDLEVSIGKSIEQPHPNSSQHALLRVTGGLSVDDIHAFIVHFVLRGRTAELRSIASKTTQKLLHNISPEGHSTLFQKLMSGQALGEIGGLGCAATEFLEFLQAFVSAYGSNVRNQIPDASKVVGDCFIRQLWATRKDLCGGMGDEASIMKIESEPGKTMRKRFNLSNCVHCHRKRIGLPERSDEKASLSGAGTRLSGSSPKDSAAGNDSSSSGRATSQGGRSSTSSKATPSVKPHSEVPWLLDQVRPYSRSALEASTVNVVSTEFASYMQLKFRMAISHVHLSVTDPRNRLVKKIGVYFSPRQVSDVQELKSEEYNDTWQRCGTMTMTRGAAQASCELVTPVIAANLKFEFMEFYEKVGGARSTDGGLLLHCPRCTRVVNNAHGVCGNCGEVAFQCRKCRHINYDRLDAFLCIECGYCASGSFSFEVTAGIALNATAILDEEGLERAVTLLRIAHRRLAEARSNLKKKLLMAASVRRKRSHHCDYEDLDELNKYGPALKRAMLGDLPKSGVKGHGDGGGGGDSPSKRSNSLSSFSSSRGSSSRLSAANKARSLLSLARQLRSVSGGSGAENERSSRGDLLVRQALLNAGPGGSIEFFDDSADGDMYGIVNTSGMPDPLSRLVANIQARVRSSTSSGSGGGNDTGGTGSRQGSGGGGDDDGQSGSSQPNDQSPRAQMEECDRLFRQKLEAERECYELQRRIDGWNRLDSDVLADYGPTASLISASPVYLPTSCSVCSGSITFHLLMLAMAIFRGGIDRAERALSRDFVAALFDESQNISAKLSELKRLAIITLTIKSRIGAKLVFDELHTRLMATHDVVSAEILGHLIEHQFDGSDIFVQLAMEVLDVGM